MTASGRLEARGEASRVGMVREGIAARPEDEANVGVFELDAAAADALSRIQEHVGNGGDGKRLREPLGMRDGTDGRHVDGKARKAPARRRARAARRVVVARADAVPRPPIWPSAAASAQTAQTVDSP